MVPHNAQTMVSLLQLSTDVSRSVHHTLDQRFIPFYERINLDHYVAKAGSVFEGLGSALAFPHCLSAVPPILLS